MTSHNPGPTAAPFILERLGVVLRPDQDNPYEQGGVLNPAAAVHDGITYLFYRAVATDPPNYSRILVARCDAAGDGSVRAVRLGHVALEPREPYEIWPDRRGGGVEDPRITFLEGAYYMAYVGYSIVEGFPMPRVALARSSDLREWERMGLVHYEPLRLTIAGQTIDIDLNRVSNKDAMLFPERVGGRYCLLHRPMFPPTVGQPQSIWLSWSDDLVNWGAHQLVLPPSLPWESLKVGGGTPPIRTPYGWLAFYHGVEGSSDLDPNRRYHAGALLLDLDDPSRVAYQSPQPVLSPVSEDEREGVVSNVVFPTGAVLQPEGLVDVYYGMADQAIGSARALVPAAWSGPDLASSG